MTIDRRAFLHAAVGTAAAMGLSAPTGRALAGLLQDGSGRILEWSPIERGKAGVKLFVSGQEVGGGNSMIIASGPVVTVIDSKYAHVAGSMERDAMSVAEEELIERNLINTHHHADHSGGNAMFRMEGWDVMAHHRAIARITAQFDRLKQASENSAAHAGRENYTGVKLANAVKASETADGLTPKDFTPNIRFDGDYKPMVIGDTIARLNSYSTGHTDGDLFIHLPDENVVHTGDLCFNGLHPFCDAEGGVNFDNWVITLRGIANLCDDDTIVVPGHGPVGGKDVVANQITYFERLRESVQKQISGGKTREIAIEESFDWMKPLGFDRIRPIAIGVMYDTLKGDYKG